MAKKRTRVPVGLCPDYQLQDSGVIKIARCFKSPVDPWVKGARVPDYLDLVDHSFKLGQKKYKKELSRQEQRLSTLVRRLKDEKMSLVVVFQGRDGAGKTGASKRIVDGVDDWRLIRVIPIGAPTDEERSQPYMLRFFERDRMPAFGEVRILDRSWAEEVLVVPVMELASKTHVHNCYSEIRTLEWLVRRSRTIVVKIWLDITKDEQESRFAIRQKEKPWKYLESDEVAFKHWDDYTLWGNRLFYWTGSEYAPWFVVPADDKLFSRVTCLKVINNEIEKELESAFRSV
ncbi:MAG: hypothetical protein K8F91_05420 [Candidatus Obscuribacterales bacterium]|nr:hypothetical protein [Candidatus Obscuribacterales bacterium]